LWKPKRLAFVMKYTTDPTPLSTLQQDVAYMKYLSKNTCFIIILKVRSTFCCADTLSGMFCTCLSITSRSRFHECPKVWPSSLFNDKLLIATSMTTLNTTVAVKEEVFISFDIEADGRYPCKSNMLQLAACACRYVANPDWVSHNDWVLNEFRVHILPQLNHGPDRITMEFLKTQPQMLEDNKKLGIPPVDAANKLLAWVKMIDENYKIKEWVGAPAAFDWQWLKAFVGQNLYDPNMSMEDEKLLNRLFPHKARCISSMLDVIARMPGLEWETIEEHTTPLNYKKEHANSLSDAFAQAAKYLKIQSFMTIFIIDPNYKLYPVSIEYKQVPLGQAQENPQSNKKWQFKSLRVNNTSNQAIRVVVKDSSAELPKLFGLVIQPFDGINTSSKEFKCFGISYITVEIFRSFEGKDIRILKFPNNHVDNMTCITVKQKHVDLPF
jgi:hypothetical protein